MLVQNVDRTPSRAVKDVMNQDLLPQKRWPVFCQSLTERGKSHVAVTVKQKQEYLWNEV